MITDDRLQKALTYLSETDRQAAELKTDVERQDYRRKRIRANLIAYGDGAMELRKARAEDSEEYDSATNDWLDAFQACEEVLNKRKTEALVVEVWRSMNRNRREGLI